MRIRMAIHCENYALANKLKGIAFKNNVFRHMVVHDKSIDAIKMTIGKNGNNFKNISEEQNLYAIWYDITSETIEFWGEVNDDNSLWNTGIYCAMNKVKYMIEKNNMYYGDKNSEIIYDKNGKITCKINKIEFEQDAEQWYAHTYFEDTSENIGAYKEYENYVLNDIPEIHI